jgi:hypothetical protein
VCEVEIRDRVPRAVEREASHLERVESGPLYESGGQRVVGRLKISGFSEARASRHVWRREARWSMGTSGWGSVAQISWT